MASYHTKHAWSCPLNGRPYGELADCTCQAPGSKAAREAAGKGRARRVKGHRGDPPEQAKAPDAPAPAPPNPVIQISDLIGPEAAERAAAIAEQGPAIVARAGIATSAIAVQAERQAMYLDIGVLGAEASAEIAATPDSEFVDVDDDEDELGVAIRPDEHPMIYDRRRLDRLGDLISTASGRLVSLSRGRPVIAPSRYAEVKQYAVIVSQVCPACRESIQAKVMEGDKLEIELVGDIGREARRSRLTHRCPDIVRQLELLTDDELAHLAHDLERDGTALIERSLACERELAERRVVRERQIASETSKP